MILIFNQSFPRRSVTVGGRLQDEFSHTHVCARGLSEGSTYCSKSDVKNVSHDQV